jgi:hypothetical protein
MEEELKKLIDEACALIPTPRTVEVSWRRCCEVDLPTKEELAFEVLTQTGLIHKKGDILHIMGEVDNSYDFEHNPDLTMPKLVFKVIVAPTDQ